MQFTSICYTFFQSSDKVSQYPSRWNRRWQPQADPRLDMDHHPSLPGRWNSFTIGSLVAMRLLSFSIGSLVAKRLLFSPMCHHVAMHYYNTPLTWRGVLEICVFKLFQPFLWIHAPHVLLWSPDKNIPLLYDAADDSAPSIYLSTHSSYLPLSCQQHLRCEGISLGLYTWRLTPNYLDKPPLTFSFPKLWEFFFKNRTS